jgi:isopentenyl-diphosphate delta-isomerase
MFEKEYVTLVDENDNDIGVMEKLEAHQKGLLHRAFSVFIFNNKEELLLQQRSISKYHSGGLWTNTCCSHPRPNETLKDAANRRLFEEMGMTSDLSVKTSIVYKADFDNGLTEHEFDYILVGTSEQLPIINIEEVSEYKWESLNEIKKNIALNPHQYTAWFRIAIEKVF